MTQEFTCSGVGNCKRGPITGLTPVTANEQRIPGIAKGRGSNSTGVNRRTHGLLLIEKETIMATTGLVPIRVRHTSEHYPQSPHRGLLISDASIILICGLCCRIAATGVYVKPTL